MDNEWGIAQAPVTGPVTAAVAAATPTVTTAIGVGVGALGGALVGGLAKHALIGAAIGGLAGGAAGYYAGSSAVAAAAAAGTSTPTGTLPAGPYTLLTSNQTLQPGGTYLISAQATTSPMAAALQGIVGELQQSGMTVLGSWSGLPPSGWPANDPNAAGGLFVAAKITGSIPEGQPVGTDVTVFAAAGTAAPTPAANLPPGPYKSLGPNGAMIAGETYLLSASGAAATALNVSLNNPSATVLTVLGTWSGKPPAGWPTSDTTAPSATSVYASVTVSQSATGIVNPGTNVNVYTTNGYTS